jgi:hypothetical protein
MRLPIPLAILASAMLLLWPAFWNGWPLIFSDTADYLWVWTQPPWFRTIRPPAYGWAIVPLHLGATLWPVIAAQALLTAWLIRLVLRRAGLKSGWHLLGVSAALALVSGAPWFASWVMADAMTAPMVLAGVALALGGLHRAEAIGAWLVLLIGAASHVTHLPVLAAMLAILLLARIVRRDAAVSFPGLAAGLAALVLAPTINIVANWLDYGEPVIAFGSSMFLGARLIGDGLMQDYLTAHCPNPAWSLCADIARLPRDSDVFLWGPDSVVGADFFRLDPELADLNPRVILAYWREFLWNGLVRAAHQLVTAEVGTDLSVRVNEDRALLARLVIPRFENALGPEAAAALDAARQTNEEIARMPLARLAGPVSLAAACVVWVWLALDRRAGHAPIALLALATTVAVLANAITVGLGGAVHDRYAARLMWLFPLILAMLVADALSRRVQSPRAEDPRLPRSPSP